MSVRKMTSEYAKRSPFLVGEHKQSQERHRETEKEQHGEGDVEGLESEVFDGGRGAGFAMRPEAGDE